MAFGDNGKRKKTMFEKVTLFVVLIMLFVTLAGIFATALGAFKQVAKIETITNDWIFQSFLK